MTNIYITGEFLKGKRYLPVLYPNLGELKNEKCLFSDLGNRAFKRQVFNVVANINNADFILLPHDFFDVTAADKNYLQKHIELARQSGKKLLIFDLSDYTDREIDAPDSWVFRMAGYRGRMKNNVIIMPAFVEDLSQYGKIFWRKKNGRPVIGFCGWAEFKNWCDRLKFFLKNLLIDLRSIAMRDGSFKAHKQGIYFRMRAIKALRKCRDVTVNFIIRGSYSSHINTIEVSSEDARRQYVDNILNSDLLLATRGDANYSCRFYEILSLGRAPLFIDTNCILPLEDVIDYKKFVLFTDYQNLKNIGKVAADFYNNLNNEEFALMQMSAREAFVKYLNPISFLEYILPKLTEKII